MLKCVGLVGNLAKENLLGLCRQVMGWCAKRGIAIHAAEELYPHIFPGGEDAGIVCGRLKECDLICVMGGDGFLLHAARLIYPNQIPILTVNLGSLGFNAQTSPQEILNTLDYVHENRIPTMKRFLLKVTPPKRDAPLKPALALNDALLIKETRSRLIHVDVVVDGISIGEFPCDGILVSTPTGSTAYNLSAGGPLVHPALNVMTIVPICPHTLSARPIVLPASACITLCLIPKKNREEALFCTDGQIWWELKARDEVSITRAPAPLIMVEIHPERYFNKLRTKFHWGSPRNA